MHPQLQEVVNEFQQASARLDRLRDRFPAPDWVERSEPDRWSAIECVAHLNLTAEAYVPRISEGLGSAPKADARRRYRRDPMGWFLWKLLAPPVRFRTKTAAEFVPGADQDPDTTFERFTKYQEQQIELVERCDGLQIDRVKIRSPFDDRIQYNVWSALTILPAHQHRHLWQAEQALEFGA